MGGPKSGRSLGLSHFDAKRPYATQRKQLSNHAPDRVYIRHWLADDYTDVVASSSSHQGHLHKRLTRGHRGTAVQGASSESRPTRGDKDQNRETTAKYQVRMGQFREHVPVQLSESIGKGKGEHRCEH